MNFRTITGAATRTLRLLMAGAVLGAIALPSPSEAKVAQVPQWFSFDSPDEPKWVIVNDGVMGGVSSSRVQIERGSLRFAGKVSLQNNGGFASTRSIAVPGGSDERVENASAIALRVRGTKTRFRLTLETPDGWYWADVSPKATWQELEIPYGDFKPYSRFGEVLAKPAFAGQPVDRVGMMMYNKRAERFSFELDWITLR